MVLDTIYFCANKLKPQATERLKACIVGNRWINVQNSVDVDLALQVQQWTLAFFT